MGGCGEERLIRTTSRSTSEMNRYEKTLKSLCHLDVTTRSAQTEFNLLYPQGTPALHFYIHAVFF